MRTLLFLVLAACLLPFSSTWAGGTDTQYHRIKGITLNPRQENQQSYNYLHFEDGSVWEVPHYFQKGLGEMAGGKYKVFQELPLYDWEEGDRIVMRKSPDNKYTHLIFNLDTEAPNYLYSRRIGPNKARPVETPSALSLAETSPDEAPLLLGFLALLLSGAWVWRQIKFWVPDPC